MNRNAKSLAMLIGLVAGSSGCGARMAVIAHEKQAYVVKEHSLGFNSDMYFCDASSGRPVCRKTEEGQ